MYYEDSGERKCQYLGELGIPIPFTILAFVFSVGVAISSFVKGSDKDGREQKGTAFFVTMLAIVDFMLRICWALLSISVYNKEYYATFGCILGLIGFSLFINIFLWRRYWATQYRFQKEDPLFSVYAARYPVTVAVLIFFSYLVTF